jgi:hypothetical protein
MKKLIALLCKIFSALRLTGLVGSIKKMKEIVVFFQICRSGQANREREKRSSEDS